MTEATLHSAFAPLRIQGYLRLWLGSSIVFLGVMAQAVARSWLAFDLTGTSAAIGGMLLPFGLALMLAMPVAGMVGDRFAKRTVLTSSIAVLALTSTWMGVAVAFDVVEYWMLVVVATVQAVAFAFYGPARTALLTAVVPERQIPEALTMMTVNVEIARVVGPAVAGVAIGVTWGLQGVFLGCAVLFATGMWVGLRLPRGMPHPHHTAAGPWGDIVDGIRYVRGRRDLTLLLGCALGVTGIGLPYLALLPAVSEELFHRGSAGYGGLSAVSAGAAVVTGLLGGRLRRRIGAWQVIVLSRAVIGAALLALGLAPSYPAALLAIAPVGAGMLVFDTATQALVLQRSEQRLHARIQSISTLGLAAYGVLSLPLGMLADVAGLRFTLGSMGCMTLAIVTVFWKLGRPLWQTEVPELPAEVGTSMVEDRRVF